MLQSGLQDIALAVGQTGCLALCYVDVAGDFQHRQLDPIFCIKRGIEEGYIFFDKKAPTSKDNMYVQFPADFLKLLTGVPWRVEKVNPEDKPKKGYLINYWVKTKEGRMIGSHFERSDFKPMCNRDFLNSYLFSGYRVCVPLQRFDGRLHT